MKLSNIPRAFLWRFVNRSYPLWQRMGYHVTPVHFYQPVPDTRRLREDLWREPSQLVGLDMREDEQVKLLECFAARFDAEYAAIPADKTPVAHQYYTNNGLFESVDGEMLYGMIRHFKPRRIFEIGSGNSTYLAAQAVLKNKEEWRHECELVAFEPYPNETLRAGFPGLTQLVMAEAQDVPFSQFEELEENDILFIDSSHVLKIGSDVQYEYLEVIPRLKRGVIVHVHDIFMPAEYPKKWVMEDRTFWNEQYLLQAFLAFNESFQVMWGGSYMNMRHADKLEAAFKSYRRGVTWPGSFWFRRVQ